MKKKLQGAIIQSVNRIKIDKGCMIKKYSFTYPQLKCLDDKDAVC